VAEAYSDRVWAGWATFDEVVAPDWLAEATRAVELNPESGWARLQLAYYHGVAGNGARYAQELERAADLAGGDALLMVFVAGELPWVGQTTRAADMLDRAVRLDPNSIDRNRWVQVFVHFHARRYEDAATALEIIGAPTMDDKVRGAMTYAQLGRADDLERWCARLLEQSPDFSAESYFDILGDYALER
jgi:tetratricopeptide (TPR) repeat protein